MLKLLYVLNFLNVLLRYRQIFIPERIWNVEVLLLLWNCNHSDTDVDAYFQLAERCLIFSQFILYPYNTKHETFGLWIKFAFLTRRYFYRYFTQHSLLSTDVSECLIYRLSSFWKDKFLICKSVSLHGIGRCPSYSRASVFRHTNIFQTKFVFEILLTESNRLHGLKYVTIQTFVDMS